MTVLRDWWPILLAFVIIVAIVGFGSTNPAEQQQDGPWCPHSRPACR